MQRSRRPRAHRVGPPIPIILATAAATAARISVAVARGRFPDALPGLIQAPLGAEVPGMIETDRGIALFLIHED